MGACRRGSELDATPVILPLDVSILVVSNRDTSLAQSMLRSKVLLLLLLLLLFESHTREVCFESHTREVCFYLVESHNMELTTQTWQLPLVSHPMH